MSALLVGRYVSAGSLGWVQIAYPRQPSRFDYLRPLLIVARPSVSVVELTASPISDVSAVGRFRDRVLRSLARDEAKSPSGPPAVPRVDNSTLVAEPNNSTHRAAR